jgi:hypothetical protein
MLRSYPLVPSSFGSDWAWVPNPQSSFSACGLKLGYANNQARAKDPTRMTLSNSEMPRLMISNLVSSLYFLCRAYEKILIYRQGSCFSYSLRLGSKGKRRDDTLHVLYASVAEQFLLCILGLQLLRALNSSVLRYDDQAGPLGG